MNLPCKYCERRVPATCLTQGVCIRCEAFVRDYKDAHGGSTPTVHELERFATKLMEEVSPATYRAFSYSQRLSVGAIAKMKDGFK